MLVGEGIVEKLFKAVRKAPGLDCISGKLLRLFFSTGFDLFCYVFRTKKQPSGFCFSQLPSGMGLLN